MRGRGGARRLLALALAGAVLPSCRARESQSPADWKACRQADPIALYDGASLLDDGGALWIAGVDSLDAAVPHLSLHRADPTEDLTRPAVATLVGTNPSLVRLDADELGLLYRAALRDGGCDLLFRRYQIDSGRWSRPSLVAAGDAVAPLAANGRLLHTKDGLLFPAIEFAQPGVLSKAEIVLYVSSNGGKQWSRRPVPLERAALAPALATTPEGALILVVNCLGLLHRTVSTDGGSSWSALEAIGIQAQESPHALCQANGTELMLAWTEAQPHKTEVAPRIRALRWSTSTDAGRSWTPPRTLAAHPGWVPRAPALAASAGQLRVALEQSQGEQRRSLLLTLPLAALRGEADGVEPRRRRDNLRALVAHTMQRTERAPWLFVECYFMRSLLAAHTALAPFASEHADWLDTSRGVELAREYADQLVQLQLPSGYWSIGYKHQFVADMSVGLGLFRDLAPHVDEERSQRYVGAATRFFQALERDALLLDNGAVGVGRPGGAPFDRTPYIVSTALAGAAARAWLFAATGEESWRRGSLESLRWLVGQIRPDGSVPGFDKEEPLSAAAYMGEGVPPALALANADETNDFDAALHRHMGWILRQQRRDGTWGEPGSGVPLRSPLLVNFLLWMNARMATGVEVRCAVDEADKALDFDAWRADAVFAPGVDAEIYRALAGVPLAAMVQDKPVF